MKYDIIEKLNNLKVELKFGLWAPFYLTMMAFCAAALISDSHSKLFGKELNSFEVILVLFGACFLLELKSSFRLFCALDEDQRKSVHPKNMILLLCAPAVLAVVLSYNFQEFCNFDMAPMFVVAILLIFTHIVNPDGVALEEIKQKRGA